MTPRYRIGSHVVIADARGSARFFNGHEGTVSHVYTEHSAQEVLYEISMTGTRRPLCWESELVSAPDRFALAILECQDAGT